jgi:hypothetical protein
MCIIDCVKRNWAQTLQSGFSIGGGGFHPPRGSPQKNMPWGIGLRNIKMIHYSASISSPEISVDIFYLFIGPSGDIGLLLGVADRRECPLLTSFYSPPYFSPRRGCLRILTFCMGHN